MKLDFTNCKTAEDVERVMRPLGDLMAQVKRLVAGDVPGKMVVDNLHMEVGEITVEIEEEPKPRRKRRVKGGR